MTKETAEKVIMTSFPVSKLEAKSLLSQVPENDTPENELKQVD